MHVLVLRRERLVQGQQLARRLGAGGVVRGPIRARPPESQRPPARVRSRVPGVRLWLKARPLRLPDRRAGPSSNKETPGRQRDTARDGSEGAARASAHVDMRMFVRVTGSFSCSVAGRPGCHTRAASRRFCQPSCDNVLARQTRRRRQGWVHAFMLAASTDPPHSSARDPGIEDLRLSTNAPGLSVTPTLHAVAARTTQFSRTQRLLLRKLPDERGAV